MKDTKVKKYVIGMLIMAVILLILVFASADAFQISDQVQIPEQILTYLSNEKLSGFTATSCITGLGNSSEYAFVMLQGNSQSILYTFKQKNNKWSFQYKVNSGIPQGSGRITIRDGYGNNRFVIAKENDSQEYWVSYVYYELKNNSTWCLKEYSDRDRRMRVVVSENKIAYYGGMDIDYFDQFEGNVYGTIQTDLRYANLSNIPNTIQEARNKYTLAPSIPAGTLSAEVIKFTGGKKYAVHSAPDKNSFRSAKGKAAVSTNDWIQVFGREDNWILIQYAIDSDHYRFGYIDKKSLPKKADVPELGFDRNVVYIANDVFVTDDPLYSRATIATLQEGTSVTLLASMGEDAYIEGQTNGETFRGFVPLQAITAENNRFTTYTDENGTTFNLFSVSRLNMDDKHHVESVTGMYERIVYGEECVEPDEAPGSKVTYRLAENFHAEMVNSMTEPEMHNIPVTDLYQWYIDAYIGRDHYDGHDIIFCDDLTEEQMETVNPDFWFVETKIQLNEQNEIEYMEYVSVPWA